MNRYLLVRVEIGHEVPSLSDRAAYKKLVRRLESIREPILRYPNTPSGIANVSKVTELMWPWAKENEYNA